MNKAVFLDRDGTINIEKHYLYKIEDFEFLPGTVEGLKKLQDAGYLLIVITNQSGIARGYYTEEDYWQLTEFMLSELEKQGVHLTDVLYCPHLPDARILKYRIECECRKPKLGLFYEATRKWNVDLNQSWVVGDKERDLVLSNYGECRGILIQANRVKTDKGKIRCASNLLEAAEIILEHS